MEAPSFEVTSLLGPLGGQLALAFGAGCAAGYAFCIRTVYRLLNAHTEQRHADCEKKVAELKEECDDLKTRMGILEDRLYHGNIREKAQIRDSGVRLLGEIQGDKKDG